MTEGRPVPIEARLRGAGLPALPRLAWLEIDLDALAGNVRAIAGALPAGVTLEAVVKANAYGHGAPPVARTVLAAGARGLCVATLDEGLALRRAGLTGPVLVLFPIPPDGVVAAARAGIAVTAGDPAQFERDLAAYATARRRGRRPLPDLGVHLGLETGLGRDGLTATEAVAVAEAVARTDGVRILSAWTHLQAAEDRARSDRQAERFEATLAALAAAGHPAPHRHLLASAGVISVERYVGGERPVFDGVRVGLALYGLAPDRVPAGTAGAEIDRALRPVLALRARPFRVASLPAGEGVGYGPSFVTARPSRIATLPVGYGDGWSRALGNRADALVRGVRVPLVGTVAMDAVMVDVTDVPGPAVTTADEFTLIGRQGALQIAVAEVANTRSTITWEVVTTMAARLPRVYTAAARTVGLTTLTIDREPWPRSRSGAPTTATSRSTRS